MAPAPRPDAAAAEAEAWLARLIRRVGLARGQGMVQVYHAQRAWLRPLLVALEAKFGPVRCLVEAQGLEQAADNDLVLLAPRRDDLRWLNLHRPLLEQRHLCVVLWAEGELAVSIREEAPDFASWITHHVEPPPRAPGFTVARLRAAGDRVAWGGGDLELALREAGRTPPRNRVDARAPYPALVAALSDGTPAAIEAVSTSRELRRVEWALAETGERPVYVLEPRCPTPGWAAVHALPCDWAEATQRLGGDARRAALLDLEPEAVEAAERADAGSSEAGAGEAAAVVPEDEVVALLRGPFDAGRRVEAARRALDLGHPDVAAWWAEQAVAATQEGTLERAGAFRELGRALRALGDLDGARQALKRSLEIERQVRGTEEHLEVAASLHALAAVLHAQGDLNGARRNLERALEIERAALGTEEHPAVAASLHELAGVLHAQGDLAGARRALERSLEIKRAVLGTDEHPDVAASMHALAQLLHAQGDLAGARQALERALEIQRARLGTDDHPNVTASLHALAGIEAAEGDLDAALARYEHVLAIEQRLYGTKEHYSSAMTEEAIGRVLLRLGRPAEALPRLQHALSVYRAQLGEEHPYTVNLARELADLQE